MPANCHFGGDNGQFQFMPRGTCTQSPLHTTPTQQTFLSASMNQTVTNYDGDISDAFSCIAALGDKGCGFEGQLKSVRWSLDPVNPPRGNEGFLREDATLAVVLITNEDDCSVPDDSDLADPTQTRMADPLGPFQSFRCNEFGHLCNINGTMQPPPRCGRRPPAGLHLQRDPDANADGAARSAHQGRRRGRLPEGAEGRPVADRGRGDHRTAHRLQRRDGQDTSSRDCTRTSCTRACRRAATTPTRRCASISGSMPSAITASPESICADTLNSAARRDRQPHQDQPRPPMHHRAPCGQRSVDAGARPRVPGDGRLYRRPEAAAPDRAAGLRRQCDAALLDAGRRHEVPRRQEARRDPRRRERSPTA